MDLSWLVRPSANRHRAGAPSVRLCLWHPGRTPVGIVHCRLVPGCLVSGSKLKTKNKQKTDLEGSLSQGTVMLRSQQQTSDRHNRLPSLPLAPAVPDSSEPPVPSRQSRTRLSLQQMCDCIIMSII